jgi:hypothetical protein
MYALAAHATPAVPRAPGGPRSGTDAASGSGAPCLNRLGLTQSASALAWSSGCDRFLQFGDPLEPSADGYRGPVATAVAAEPNLLLVSAFLEGESLGVGDRQGHQGEARVG